MARWAGPLRMVKLLKEQVAQLPLEGSVHVQF